MKTLNLFENAIDSLKHGLKHLANFHGDLSVSDAKQAIMNLIHAIDLLILEKLRRIDENAIYSPHEEDIFGVGYRPTIHVEMAYKKIKDYISEPQYEEKEAYDVLKVLRNSAVHSEFSFGDERKKNIVFLLHYIARFLENELGEKLEVVLSPDEFQFYLLLIEGLEYADVIHERMEAARHELIRSKIEWFERLSIKNGGGPVVADWDCHNCGEKGVSLYEKLAPIGECAFCSHRHHVEFCERCGYAIDVMLEGRHLFDSIYWCDSCWEWFERL